MAEVNGTATEPRTFWEDRYGAQEQMWSGRVNSQLADVVRDRSPGAALDLGSGEGGDALWLAERGWTVTALDISQTALDRGAVEAERRGVDDAVVWLQRDLTDWDPVPGAYELVSACFLQSPIDFPRAEILRTAARAVAPGGALFVVGHAGPPPWASGDEAPSEPGGHGHGTPEAHEHGHPELPSAAETLELLRLDPATWTVLICEDRPRAATAPDGSAAELLDAVVFVERRSPE